MNLENRKTEYSMLSLMILLTGVLIYAVGVMVEEIFDIKEIAICGIIIIGVSSLFFCFFIFKELVLK